MSNFFPTSFCDNYGHTFNCSEQYFMYHKCLTFDKDNSILLNNILSNKSPTKIKAFGNRQGLF